MSSNSGYDNRGGDSQIRSIIKQLNEEKPSKEKSREVVVRSDGTKVVRVVKKRKVMISSEEKTRKTKRRLLWFVLAVFVFGGLLAAFFSMRMATMSKDSYIEDRQAELCEAWGAKSVRCVGAQVKGFLFTAESLVAEFPESSMIERVELRNVSAALSSATFFSGVLEGDELKIDTAEVRIRDSVDKLNMPPRSNKELWRFKRFSCNNFNLHVGEESMSPLTIAKSSAYMYSPSLHGSALVVVLEGGTLQLKGWDNANIASAKLLLSPSAIEDFSIECAIPDPAANGEEHYPRFVISGKAENGADLAGPYRFTSSNVRFDLLSDRRFARFFSGTTDDNVGAGAVANGYINLPFHKSPMSFHGKFKLRDATVFGFPALDILNRHVRTSRNQTYTPTVVKTASVELMAEDGKLCLSMADVVDPDKICMKGKVGLDAENNLSGTLEYGIPVALSRAEYTDQFSDRMFNDDGRYAWLATTVSGNGNTPADNAAELDKAAEPTREGRKRCVDLDKFVDNMVKSGMEEENGDSSSASKTPVTDPAPGDSMKTPAPVQKPTPEPSAPAPAETPTPAPAPAEDTGTRVYQLPSDDIFTSGGSGAQLPSDGIFTSGDSSK